MVYACTFTRRLRLGANKKWQLRTYRKRVIEITVQRLRSSAVHINYTPIFLQKQLSTATIEIARIMMLYLIISSAGNEGDNVLKTSK